MSRRIRRGTMQSLPLFSRQTQNRIHARDGMIASRNAIIAPMTARGLLNKLHDQPFQPFRVRLSDNTTMDVLDPNTVVVGPSSAIMPMESVLGDHSYYLVTRWRTVALAHMVEFVDIDPPKQSSKRRRAS